MEDRDAGRYSVLKTDPLATVIVRFNYLPPFNYEATMKRLWSLWAKALGEKQGKTDSDADVVAMFRTLIVLVYVTTNIFIIAGIIRHW